MKQMILGLTMVVGLVGLTAFAAEAPLKVSVAEEDSTIQIHFETKKTFNSICMLQVNRLELVEANKYSKRPSSITIEAAVDPSYACLPALGPNSGVVSLQKGFGLPSIHEGSYDVVINGTYYGQLVIDHYSAFLTN